MIGLGVGLVFLLVVVAIVVGIVALVGRRKGSGDTGAAARDVLLQLLTTATLYLTVLGVLLVVWSLAEYWFPQFPDARGSAMGDGPMRVGIAMAVVAFPVFLFMSSYLKKRRSPETSSLRLAFAYINLFVVMVTALVDLMVVVHTYLDGDLTPRFLIRAAGVMLMAGLVYLYYRADSSRETERAAVSTGQPEPQT